MKNLITILILTASLSSLFSCGTKKSLGNGPRDLKGKAFLAEYNKYLGSSEKDSVYAVKLETEKGGEWIVISDMHAVNLAEYEKGNIVDLINPTVYSGDYSEPVFERFNSIPGPIYIGEPGFIDVYEYGGYYGSPILDTTYNYESDDYYHVLLKDGTLTEAGYANFETLEGAKKDLERIGSNNESQKSEELIYNLEENYGLSVERAESVAKITSSFKKIQNKRSLTAKEMNIYTQKVLGVNYDAGKKALEKHIQGDSAEMDELMERAADLNGTSPEAVQDLMGEYLLKN